jgi:hypothetical protein
MKPYRHSRISTFYSDRTKTPLERELHKRDLYETREALYGCVSMHI